MNSIDLGVFIVILLSTLVGFIKGGLSSILSTLGWIIAIISNHYLFNSIAPFLEAKFQSKLLTFIIGYISGFLIILFLISIINFLILMLLKQFRNSTIDKILGTIFGGIRGILIIVVVFLCFDSGLKALSGEETYKYPKVISSAATLPIIKNAELKLLNYIPNNFKEQFMFAMNIQDGYQISDIAILNIIRKLSMHLSQEQLNIINQSVDKNSQYMSKRQILIAKLKALYNTKSDVSNLTQEDINNIQSLIS